MLEKYEGLVQEEKSVFMKVCRKLLAETFIVRDYDDNSRKYFLYASKYYDLIEEYMKIIGYSIVYQKEDGIIMLSSNPNSDMEPVKYGHHKLSKDETKLLLCLRIIYGEKMRAGVLTRNIIVPFHEIMLTLKKYHSKAIMDNVYKAVRLFSTMQKFNLVKLLGDIGKEECKVCIYPSIMYSLNEKEMEEWLKSNSEGIIKAETKTTKKEETEKEEVEESDEEE